MPPQHTLIPASPHGLKRVEAIGECARGDDLRIIFFGRVNIVIIVIESGRPQCRELLAGRHTQRHAGFQPERLHGGDDPGQFRHIAVLDIAPGRAHTKTLRADGPGAPGRGKDGLLVHQFLILQARLVAGGLRAIFTVFRQPPLLIFSSVESCTVLGSNTARCCACAE